LNESVLEPGDSTIVSFVATLPHARSTRVVLRCHRLYVCLFSKLPVRPNH
jgi:hypothetical protein